MIEFKDKDVQKHYDFLKMQEEDLLDELAKVQSAIALHERIYEHE